VLFGGPFQAPERVGGPGDQPPAKDRLQEPTPPTWREAKCSIERRATRVGVDGCDLNLLTILDAKGQRNVKRELPRRLHVEHVEDDVQHAGSKDKTITGAHCSPRPFDRFRPGPLRQLMGVGQQAPDALGRREDDICRAHLHSSVSLAPGGVSRSRAEIRSAISCSAPSS
jgi:hypothetical protein